MNIKSINSKIWLLAFFGLPFITFAQESNVSPSAFSNQLFLIMIAVIILLLIIIVGLANVLKNISQSDFLQDLINSEKGNDSKSANIKSAVLIFFTVLAYNASAANNEKGSNSWSVGGLDAFTFSALSSVILLELIIIAAIYLSIQKLLKPENATSAYARKLKQADASVFDKLNAAVDVESEHEILLDHDYDGIKELDNNLPPWWKYGFYLTIVVAFIYMIHYHVAHTGDLQNEEYDKEMAKAKAEVDAFMKNSSNNVDETNVKMLESPADIESGKQIYIGNCVVCHGKFGEGGVGPNFADDYWMHGGSIQDIFKTIKYGFAEKGMKAWKDDLSPVQMAQVSSFIKTLRGTNPPNQKEKQGELYTEGNAAASDSTQVIAGDSLSAAVVADTISKVSPEPNK
jgi:cytochrome c oxidase cbb3-type subunit 3